MEKEVYVKQLKVSKSYFEVQKNFLAKVNLQGAIALNIALELIDKELERIK